jgi:hypothetical protein
MIVVCSASRIATLVCFHLNSLLTRSAPVASYERSFVLLLANYVEVTFWYALWYSIACRNHLFSEVGTTLLLSILRESIAMMVVNTSGLFKPSDSWLLWAAMCSHPLWDCSSQLLLLREQ